MTAPLLADKAVVFGRSGEDLAEQERGEAIAPAGDQVVVAGHARAQAAELDLARHSLAAEAVVVEALVEVAHFERVAPADDRKVVAEGVDGVFRAVAR